jgi:hypothetical protein
LTRLEAVILDHQPHRDAAKLAALLFHRQLEGITHVFADIAARSGQGRDHADLDLCQ